MNKSQPMKVTRKGSQQNNLACLDWFKKRHGIHLFPPHSSSPYSAPPPPPAAPRQDDGKKDQREGKKERKRYKDPLQNVCWGDKPRPMGWSLGNRT